MRLYRASTKEGVVRLSPEPIPPDDLPAGCAVEEVDQRVPTVSGKIEQWQDDAGVLRLHVHYVCPRCTEEQNFDLEPKEPSPRFACCDTCVWNSVVWIEWSPDEKPNQSLEPTPGLRPGVAHL